MPVISSTFSIEGRFEKNPFDFYETPLKLCQVALNLPILEHLEYTSEILDPGCGTGNWGIAARQRWPKSHISGVDVDMRFGEKLSDNYNFVHWGTYLDQADYWIKKDRKFNIIIGNPPYSSKTNKRLAEQFVRKSLQLLTWQGILIFLLPTQFAASAVRFDNLFKPHLPRSIYQLVERPSFYGKGTNTHEYALYVWEYRPAIVTLHHWLKWKNEVEIL